MLFYHVEELIGAEALHDIERAAFLQYWDEEGRGCMRQRRRHKHAQFLGEFPFGHLDLRHIGGHAVGAHHAFGFTRRAAGEID